jgi:hypothetical protein
MQVSTEEYIAFNIKKDFLRDICWEATGRREVSFKIADSTYSRKLLNYILGLEEEIKLFRNSSPLMLKSMCIQIVIQLLREADNNVYISGSKCVPDEKIFKKSNGVYT